MNKIIMTQDEITEIEMSTIHTRVNKKTEIKKLFDKYMILIINNEKLTKLKIIVRYIDNVNFNIRVFKKEDSNQYYRFIGEMSSEIFFNIGNLTIEEIGGIDMTGALLWFEAFHEYLNENASTRVIEERLSSNHHSSSTTTSVSKKTSRSKTYLFKDIIKYVNKKTGNKNSYTITCDSWEVRGHYRRYKSGKVAFVNPFKKGKNRNSDPTTSRVYYLRKDD